MNLRAIPTVFPLSFLALLPAQQEPPKNEVPFAKLVEAVQALEAERMKDFQSATVKRRQRGEFPDGGKFEVSGTMRVLGKTHVHEVRTGRFGEDLHTEAEMVMTPEGVWTREKDPIAGEVFTFMRPELVAELKEAAAVTGRSGSVPGTSEKPQGLAAAQMLTDLARFYDFKVVETHKDGRDYWAATGTAKKNPEGEREPGMPQAEEIELLISKNDAVLARMTELRGGKPYMTVEVEDIQLNKAMDEKSFKIQLPANARWKDVKDHPAAWAQIQTLLEEAKAKRAEKDKEPAKDGKEPGK